jgi:redox-sensitive bicupin YhaK (pirin superfamily)
LSEFVNMVIEPKEKDLGDEFVVRRVIPQIKKRMIGPFVFWDHMGPVVLQGDKKMKVRAHPHIGLSTITYLFSGEIVHRDSLMNEQVIRPGEVNWMTAGSGIVHSERAESQGEPMLLEGLQVWIALPKEAEEVSPSFVHYKEADLPLISEESLRLRLVAGEWGEHKSPLPVYSPMFYLSGWAKKGKYYTKPLAENQEAALYVVNGSVKVEGQTYDQYSMVVFNKGTKLEFTADEELEFMILGGDSLPETRHIWWNFVSSDKEKIEAAKIKWKEQRFPPVINETEHIPLPSE